MSNGHVATGSSAKEKPSRAWGEGEGEGGAGIIMSSNHMGSYELKRSPWMQMEECSARLARSTSNGSADNHCYYHSHDHYYDQYYYFIEAALRRGTAAPCFLAGFAGLERSGG